MVLLVFTERRARAFPDLEAEAAQNAALAELDVVKFCCMSLRVVSSAVAPSLPLSCNVRAEPIAEQSNRLSDRQKG